MRPPIIKIVLLTISLNLSLFATENPDLLIIGAGASGTMAAIQASRAGVKTLLIETELWPGGMLTSAGVSAIDGNYLLKSGLWHEFRTELENYYGGSEALKTGWVSNVLFEPQVAARILNDMLQKADVPVWYQTRLISLKRKKNSWEVIVSKKGEIHELEAKIIIDATEQGDVAALAGVDYRIGMDSREETGEEIAPKKANDIIQDLTYVAVLKDYGFGADKTIPKPENYDPSPFYCTCAGKCNPDSITRTLWPCEKMLEYGKLPNDYYMINWPIYGNDYYLNLIEMNEDQRKKAIEKAKWYTLCYVYYLQTELGFKNLGLAEDVFPTTDHLPMIPYHRESRRIKGHVLFDLNDLAKPFEQKEPLYRTAIAVGDYPVDHHHAAYPDHKNLPDLHFYPVPSYSLPLGTLIPKNQKGIIVAEKSISVTNLVNGTTRLQPVCMLIGQAAGALATVAIKNKVGVEKVSAREVQLQLLNSKAYLMPYLDVNPENPYFESIQKIGATGILRGEGKTVGWQNQTLFHPDSLVSTVDLRNNLVDFLPEISKNTGSYYTINESIELARKLAGRNSEETPENLWLKAGLSNYFADRFITRAEFAVIIDKLAHPFERFPVDFKGNIIKK